MQRVLGQEGSPLPDKHTYVHYSMEDGLPSNRIYRMMQDSEGFLWLATDAGVSRFNGVQFDNFTTRDGLADNDILSLIEDKWGRIWFFSFNGRLSYYYKGVFYNDENSEMLGGVENSSPMLFYLEDSKGNIWVNTSLNGVIKIEENAVKQYGAGHDAPYSLNGKVVETNNIVFLVSHDLDSILKIDEGVWVIPKYDFCVNTGSPMQRSRVWRDELMVFCKEKLYWVSHFQSEHIFSFNYKIVPNRIDWQGGDSIWLNTRNTGTVLIHNSEGGAKEIDHFLPGNSTSCTLLDRNGKLWIATLDDGLFHPLDENIFQYSSASNYRDAKKIVPFTEDKFGVITNSILSLMEIGGDSIKEVGKWTHNAPVENIRFTDGRVFQWRNQTLFESFGEEPVRKVDIAFPSREIIKDFRVSEDGTQWVAISRGIYKLRGGDLIKHWPKGNNQNGIRPIIIYPRKLDSYIIGTNAGLLTCKGVDCQSIPKMNGQVSCLEEDEKGKLWVGTHGNGLFALVGDSISKKITSENGLSSDFVTDISISGNQLLVRMTAKINLLVQPERGGTQLYPLNSINDRFEGEIQDAKLVGNSLVLVARGQVYGFRLDSLVQNLHVPEVRLVNFQVNSKTIDFKNGSTLNHKQNNITIEFQGVLLGASRDLRVEYKTNNNEQWTTLRNNQIEFVSLSPGKYEIVARANQIGTTDYSPELTLNFTINSPWWYSNPAWVSYFLIFLFSMIGIVRLVLKSRERRESLNRRITQSRLTALRTQMNPHFIFNSLNSIQLFVSQNEKKEAFLFLSRFGKLMRRILENSEEDYVFIEEEINTLELYLQLEQLRTRSKFTFDFFIGDEIEVDYHKVPPTLIQPILENAIWHGIMQTEVDGHISVRFELVQEGIKITVLDNGIGISKSKELKKGNSKKHKSKAVNITRERLALLNETQKTDITLAIGDRINKDGQIEGTEVILIVPIIQEQD